MSQALSTPVTHLAPPAPPAPRGVEWLTVAEAARRSGTWDERRVRQLCAEEWLPLGQARQKRTGLRLVWEVRSDAGGGCLSRVRRADAIHDDLSDLTKAQRDQITFKETILKEWRVYLQSSFAANKTKDAATNEFVRMLRDGPRRLDITARTLRNWDVSSRAGSRGLVDGRWEKEKKPREDDPFLKGIKELYLKQTKLTLSTCHRLVVYDAMKEGFPVRSRRVCDLYIKSLPKADVYRCREGPEAWNNKYGPHIKRTYVGVDSNEQWCGDHHEFDVMVDVGGGKLSRPWISGWLDMRSRKLVGWTIFAGEPNTLSVLKAFENGAMSHGIPHLVYCDNGADYGSYALQGSTKVDRRKARLAGKGKPAFDIGEDSNGIFGRMEIDITRCWPFRGQSKPIERFFETVENDFCRTFETYFGNKPENRPENYQSKIDRGKARTLEDFTAAFSQWLEAHYHVVVHRGEGMDGNSPSLVFDENLHAKRVATPEHLAALLMIPTKPLKVGRNGVTWKGLQYGRSSRELWELVGEQVTLRIRPGQISQVQVWTLDGRFVCVAESNAKIPVNATAEMLSKEIANVKRDAKLRKQFNEARPRMHSDTTDRLIDAAHAAKAANKPAPQPPPPNLSIIQTANDGELEKARRAEEILTPRRATGTDGPTSQNRFGPADFGKFTREDEAETANNKGKSTLADFSKFFAAKHAAEEEAAEAEAEHRRQTQLLLMNAISGRTPTDANGDAP